MERYKVCVLGAKGWVGAEVCRLTVAMGHRVVGVAPGGRPDLDEPWVEGVEWVAADATDVDAWLDHLADCEALVHCADILGDKRDNPQQILPSSGASIDRAIAAAHDASVAKVVYVSPSAQLANSAGAQLSRARQAEASVEQSGIAAAILRPAHIDPTEAIADADAGARSLSESSQQPSGLRREKVAMAALRAALEPQTVGVFDHDQVDHLGDAMFIQ